MCVNMCLRACVRAERGRESALTAHSRLSLQKKREGRVLARERERESHACERESERDVSRWGDKKTGKKEVCVCVWMLMRGHACV